MDASDFKEAMSAAGRALADGLAANEEAKRERDEARAVAELRSEALRRVKSGLGAQRQYNRARVLQAVGKYCSDARADALDYLKNDKRMPRTINYLERYNALLGMDDRKLPRALQRAAGHGRPQGGAAQARPDHSARRNNPRRSGRD